MRQVFNTSVGTIEVVVDRDSDTISIYRFDAEHRAVAAAMESWSHVDLVGVLNSQAGVPLYEANTIAAELRARHSTTPSFAARVEESTRERGWSSLENAGIPLRFVAVLLDAVLFFFPLGLVFGVLSGGGYDEHAGGQRNVGVELSGSAWLFLLAIGLGYYVFFEAATGATLGKRIVGIRVVGEEGDPVTFGAAVVRNLLRVVDGLFCYLVGAIFALVSDRGQRLGDRAARTVVVRR